uniref:Protein CASC3 n=1 Tax=Glossina austeni TaxID=7395 RepID=A0A1A9UQ68_GLOAU
MAEVEKISAAIVKTTLVTAESLITSGGDGKGVDIIKGNSGLPTSVELEPSPVQEKSSNSHPHDSEYDTASDLEGDEEYDDEDEIDDSLTEDDTDSDENDDVVDIDEPSRIQDKEGEAQKKVDEDRSNPQYIPKRGTFYEHDDRTAEGEVENISTDSQQGAEGCASGAAPSTVSSGGSKSIQSPTISAASKAMKNWQPASTVDRWSHDRFDPKEQAPKSRAELVSAYGYDIRTEDAPPKARRRRRYGRGPNKYSRNWEDESAYLKTNNKERRPPKPTDFPALNEKSSKSRKSRRPREEKENRVERRRKEGKFDKMEKPSIAGHRANHSDDNKERMEDRFDNKHKNNFRGQSGRQVPMEFKQKQRKPNQNNVQQAPVVNNFNNRLDLSNQREPSSSNTHQQQHTQQQHQNILKHGQTVNKHQPNQSQQHTDVYNNNSNANVVNKKIHEHSYQTMQVSQQEQHQQAQPIFNQLNRQTVQIPNKTSTTLNLSQRLQLVQNRNDPSHVGSVQMHALATQNQHQQQQSHILNSQQPSNLMMGTQQPQTVTQEQRGPPKRYSSLRRSQHEAQHIAEQHQLQQLHMQTQQPQPQLILPDQHMLQANLMQLYHQENIQAQMQALQVSQSSAGAKQPSYATVPTPNAYPAAAPAPTTYYVTSPDAYSAATTSAQTSQSGPYGQQQQPPNYLPQNQTSGAASLAPTQTSAAPYGSGAGVGVIPQSGAATGTPTNYQNYNTVGGTTYFVPPPAQAAARQVVLPQRRPTNAIPILPPTDKTKPPAPQPQQRSNESKEDNKIPATITVSQGLAPPIGSAENIDRIIDNMFVQRPAFQPPTTTVSSIATPSKMSSNETLTDSSNISISDNNSQNNEKFSNNLANENISKSNSVESSTNNTVVPQE